MAETSFAVSLPPLSSKPLPTASASHFNIRFALSLLRTPSCSVTSISVWDLAVSESFRPATRKSLALYAGARSDESNRSTAASRADDSNSLPDLANDLMNVVGTLRRRDFGALAFFQEKTAEMPYMENGELEQQR